LGSSASVTAQKIPTDGDDDQSQRRNAVAHIAADCRFFRDNEAETQSQRLDSHPISMKIIESIPLDLVLAHLDRTHSAVRPPIDDHFHRDGYTAYRATLDDSDLDRLILYWEFKIHTKDGTCRLTDALPSSAANDRIRSFIHGNPAKGYPPADLRSTPDRQPVIVTDDVNSHILYLIDGNHRVIAQRLSGKSFQDVPVYVCVHPKMLAWAYLPANFK
jgi:hypothetical protein